ncbi:MAG TPA: isocitrate lyase/PEP mutase family protein, partial [Dehalococcoidia bacterium]|nr:isocitrate lyase/PEP mutase family protein [Dehalococcoidia bacterium]
MQQREQLRQALRDGQLVVAPTCINAFTARIIEREGFPAVYLGGYAFGAASSLTEPLTTMMEIIEEAGHIARRITKPLIVDAGAGFGEPLHVTRAIREFEWAGVAGVHIEDQHYPKRAHYHRDYREHVIPIEDYRMKIGAAVRARTDPDFVIIARTDAMRTDGYEEGIRRARAALEEGADAAMVFPNSREEAARAPKDTGGPTVYVNSWGNRVGRPILRVEELQAMGYALMVEAIPAVLVTLKAVKDVYRHLKQNGLCNLDQEEAIAL